jgi:aldehyde dehydrogenase (NAD+)
LLTDVEPASTVAQVEIFGPVLVSMTFRNPVEAVALANNTPYGLAASVWTENLSLAHDIAAKVKAGTVWINCTNQFDAASGFGGYRESGYGREGGKEGLWEYVKTAVDEFPKLELGPVDAVDGLDKTHKLFIGGKQVRPDGGYSFEVGGQEFALANRKDVRNAVEAASAALGSWSAQSGHLRAQILYYLAENLEFAKDEFGASEEEFNLSVRALFDFAAMADKFDGQVHSTQLKGIVYTLNEPVGNLAVVLDDAGPLLSLSTVIGASMSMGNAITVVASQSNPLPAALMYRLLDSSDVPAGVVNILTGDPSELAQTLADHEGVDGIWCFRQECNAEVKERSIGNLKQVWAAEMPSPTDLRTWLRHATQVKNVWVPMGE